MVWIVLYVLGVPLWMIAGALFGSLWSRRKFKRAPGAFPCKVRVATDPAAPGKWPRATSQARWVHDVLMVHSGMALVRYQALPVASINEPIAAAPDVKLKGGDPVSVQLHLDDGSVAEVASTSQHTESMSGPFLALAQPLEGSAG